MKHLMGGKDAADVAAWAHKARAAGPTSECRQKLETGRNWNGVPFPVGQSTGRHGQTQTRVSEG